MHEPSEDAPLLPGMKPVLELLERDPRRIDTIFCRKQLHSPGARQLLAICRQRKVRLCLVEQATLDRLCRPGNRTRPTSAAVSHQGVVARLTVLDYGDMPSLLAAVGHATLPIILALDQVQDPGNVGTLARTLYALGGAGLILPHHNSAYLGPAALRASAGALQRLPVARVPNLAHALDTADEAGLHIYGTATGSQCDNALTCPLLMPAVLVLGNEDKGIRPGVAKRCTSMLHIPLARDFDSLNVAQSGAILLGLAAASRARSDP